MMQVKKQMSNIENGGIIADFDKILNFQHEDFLEDFSIIRPFDKMEDFKDK